MYYCRSSRLYSFLTFVHSAQFQYYRVRREIHRRFTSLVYIGARKKSNGDVPLPIELYNSIMSFLTSRNDTLSDPAKLAFLTAMGELAELAQPDIEDETTLLAGDEHEDEESEVGSQDEPLKTPVKGAGVAS